MIPNTYFDQRSADKVKRFCETQCKLSKHPFNGKALRLLNWQHTLIDNLYGTLRLDNHERHYKQGTIFIPKKNGKSSFLSALSLFHLNEYPGSDVVCLAGTKQQAEHVYLEACRMVESNPKMNARIRRYLSPQRLVDSKRQSTMTILAAEKVGSDGGNFNCVIMDELASWGAHAREVWDKFTHSTIARKNAMKIVISTPQYDRDTIGYEQYDLAKKCLVDPSYNPRLYPMIYGLDTNEDWRMESNWYRVNPACQGENPIISKSELRDAYTLATTNPMEENSFRVLRLGQWVGSSAQWITTKVWEDCGEPFDLDLLKGRECFAGLDLSTKRDISSLVLIFRIDDLYYVLPRFWIAREQAAKKILSDKVAYDVWEREGLIKFCDGDTVGQKDIQEQIVEDSKTYQIRELRYDPYNASLLVQSLQDEYGIPCVEVPQTYRGMSPATATLEQYLKEKTIRHGNNKILNWMINNVAIRTDGKENMLIDKKATTARVDGITAMVIALTGHLAYPTYSTCELIVF